MRVCLVCIQHLCTCVHVHARVLRRRVIDICMNAFMCDCENMFSVEYSSSVWATNSSFATISPPARFTVVSHGVVIEEAGVQGQHTVVLRPRGSVF